MAVAAVLDIKAGSTIKIPMVLVVPKMAQVVQEALEGRQAVGMEVGQAGLATQGAATATGEAATVASSNVKGLVGMMTATQNALGIRDDGSASLPATAFFSRSKTGGTHLHFIVICVSTRVGLSSSLFRFPPFAPLHFASFDCEDTLCMYHTMREASIRYSSV